jgi:hypothetical protein
VAALIVACPDHGRLGHARSLETMIGHRSVLQHTVDRASRIQRVDTVVLIHPPDNQPPEVIEPDGKRLVLFAHADAGGDKLTKRLQIARRWAMSSWRGGLGDATCWDELLPASALAAAMHEVDANAAVLVGGDWCLFDPAYADALLDLHLPAPDQMKLAFTQAPPGLSPIVTSRGVLDDLAKHHATFGNALGYNPRRPAIDPIGREVNHPIPAEIRDTARRFIFDTADGQKRLQQIADHLGDRLDHVDARAVTEACRENETRDPSSVFEALPDEWIVELTTHRNVDGPAVPQHHADLTRPDLDIGLAKRVLDQLDGRCITFGGLGDAMLHPHWQELIQYAHDSGSASIHVETDLLCDHDELRALVELPIDIISVRLNADTAATYAAAMGIDAFEKVIRNLQTLFDLRKDHVQHPGVPWVVPRLVKTTTTLPDMESFFDRWTAVSGQAVIDRWPTGGTGSYALAPDLNPVPMDPPWKPPSPLQAKRRLTVRSDGQVTLCQQDWLGRATLGDSTQRDLLAIWQSLSTTAIPGGVDDSPVCRRCFDFASMHVNRHKASQDSSRG